LSVDITKQVGLDICYRSLLAVADGSH